MHVRVSECERVRAFTCEEVSDGGGRSELRLDVLGQEHDEPAHDGDLTAHGHAQHHEHRVLQQAQDRLRQI